MTLRRKSIAGSGTGTARLLATLTASLLLLLGLQAAPASAQVFCDQGHSVDGAIWTEYTQTPGVQQSLGCPTSDELGLPDGVGRRQVFDNGSIYWSPDTGAHAVWGLIGQEWAQQGWEGGYMGYPLSDELNNPDGVGVRQQFQQATVYWSPASGAHAVHGLIGSYWGEKGYERGFYGYPTSDEYSAGHVGGNVADNIGVRQDFQAGRYLLYSPGQADAFESCQNGCMGYGGTTNTQWVKKTEVYVSLRDSNLSSVHVTPTDAAFATVNPAKDSAKDHMSDTWKQVWSNIQPFPNANQTRTQSVYDQLLCHADFSYSDPRTDGDHFGGPTWDLEAWRPELTGDNDAKLKTMLSSRCNW
ncbi:DUF2599 domain-containing protein [Streptomyces sp. NBC_00083]|uniref:DUF2599 domain-containing protein n=1 Tax=Streptomyces sp. NBC_00083 TaxID=2975647 RepID=UPI00224F9062|nr:DUF2599 domain-containing protein [Streptomyces sp. NBC_00083]MCX5384177.1 DUF2599 domain-containing protein [Streptomyces sp. NBC_00083]